MSFLSLFGPAIGAAVGLCSAAAGGVCLGTADKRGSFGVEVDGAHAVVRRCVSEAQGGGL